MNNQLRQELRSKYQKIRKKLSQTCQLEASEIICSNISQLAQYDKAQHIALYRPINNEIDLDSLWRLATFQGKHCYFPILRANSSLEFAAADPSSSFHKNRLGIAEPASAYAIDIARIELIFMPLLACDRHGTRLGMGAGYYDRTLIARAESSLLIGIAYDFQRIEYIEAAPWDIALDLVISEQGIYWSTNKP